jgi:ribulose-5-phosphate 4-epimerase/fuculose-1-phosphate aldolase
MVSAPQSIVEDLVDANRILAHKRIVDGFGHVSCRSAADRFLLSRNLAPALVTAADILEFDLDSEPVADHTSSLYLERYIHGEIYRIRPDVGAIVHSHSPSLIPFGIVPTARLEPVCHMAGFLGGGAPIFEIRDVAGDASDLLIRNRALGKALARQMMDSQIVLMRGHGATVVAGDIRQATYRAVYAELNASLVLSAQALGTPLPLTRGEAAAAMTSVEGQSARAWRLWKDELGG